jgi:predicted GNAT superfamily acetyltransferase
VQWDLSSETARARALGATLQVENCAVTVAIPRDLNQLLLSNPGAALDARLRVREAIIRHFADGFAIRHYDADASAYLLIKE